MVKKRVRFYELVLEKNEQINLFENEGITLEDKVEQLSLNHFESDKFQVVDNKVFMLESFDRAHIFGTFGKIDDISSGDHIRGRNRENYSVESIKNLIESYTYFYLDLSTKKLALLQNSSLPDIKNPFAKFIGTNFRVTGLYNLQLVPVVTEEIPSKYGDEIPVLSAKISYSDDRLPENIFLNHKEILGISQSDIKKTDINITMKQGSKTNKRLFKFKKEEFSEIKLETEEETIDLINNVITKKVTIDLNSDELLDEKVIKEILKDLLTNKL